MTTVLNLTIPFFAVIALGIMAVRLGMIDGSASRIINVFVFNFTMPALVISGLARQDINELIDIPFLLGWFLAAVTVFAIGMIFSRVFFNGRLKEMALTGQAAAIGNVGFLGFPLMAAAFGTDGVRIAATALLVDLMLFVPMSIALIEASNGGAVGNSLKRVIKAGLLNPFIFAIFVGFILSATGIGLPGPTARFIDFLAGAAGPAALFALGISLAGRKFEGDGASIVVISVLKLIAHPLIAYVALSLLGVRGDTLLIGVVVASLPVAGNVFVIAQQYETMVRRISSVVLISTIIAVMTTAYALNWANVGV